VSAPATPKTPEAVVHVLRFGIVLCPAKDGLLKSVPRDWPEGHKWVSIVEADKATCESCRSIAADILADAADA